MKHPALTRLFAIVLAILCLIMLLAGTLGVAGASRDRRNSLDDRERLQSRIDDYNTVTMALAGSISYEEANRALEERQEQHEEDAAKHRTDLAIYSATKGGVQSGAEALAQAQSAMSSAWAEYNAAEAEFAKGEAAFNEGYRQYIDGRAELEAGMRQYEALRAAFDAFSAIPGSIVDIEVFQLENTQTPEEPDDADGPSEQPDDSGGSSELPDNSEQPSNWPDISEWPSEWPTEWPSEWPDEWPSELPDVSEWPSELPDILEGLFSQPKYSGALEQETEAPEEATQEPETDRPTLALEQSAQKLAASTDPIQDVLANLLPQDVEDWMGLLDPDRQGTSSAANREQAVVAYDSLLAACDGLSDFASVLSGQAALSGDMQQQVQAMTTGIVLAKQGVQAMRNSLAEGTGLVTGTELSLAKATHSACKETINSLISQVSEQISPVLEETGPALEAAWAEMEALAPSMEENKAMMEQGRKALDDAYAMLKKGSAQVNAGKAELDKTLEDLLNQAKELLEGKEALEQDSLELKRMAEETQQKKELERRQTSLRLMLLDRDGIKQRVDKGGELVKSSEAYVEQITKDTNRTFWQRLVACVLMILGGLAGIFSIPAAFEKVKRRFLLIAPPVFCLVCAAAAECIFEWMGRGSSYSAIFAGIFAIVLLLVAIPKPKKRGV